MIVPSKETISPYVLFSSEGGRPKVVSNLTTKIKYSFQVAYWIIIFYLQPVLSLAQCKIQTTNGGFEQPLIKASVATKVNDSILGGWKTKYKNQLIGLRVSGYKGVLAFEGKQFIELNATDDDQIYQDVETPYPTTFIIKFAHRAATKHGQNDQMKEDLCKISAGPANGLLTEIKTVATNSAGWVRYNMTYTVPEGQKITRFNFESIHAKDNRDEGNYLDNIELSASNGIEGATQIYLPSVSCQANIPVGGIGTWLKNPANPSNTIANLASNDNNNMTTISGFTIPGVYNYVWQTSYCKSPLKITVGSASAEKPALSTNSPIIVGGLLKLVVAGTPINTPYTLYAWSGPNGFISNEPSPTVSINATAAMSGIYTLTVSTDGCPAIPVSIQLVVNPTTAINVSKPVSNTVIAPAPAKIRSGIRVFPNLPNDVLAKSVSPEVKFNKKKFNFLKSKPNIPTREANVSYSKRIWRDIDLNDKINQVFASPKSRLMDIILDAVNTGELTAYDPQADNFLLTLTAQEVMSKLTDSVFVRQLNVKGEIVADKLKPLLFNAASITKFRIKEDWIFDKQTSVLSPRIIGIAPLINKKNPNQTFEEQPAFWIYFTEARPLFATKIIANRKNDAIRLTYDDIFIKRIFSSYIVKVSNLENARIKDYVKGIDQLQESESEKKKIINYEQDIWTY